MGTGRVPDKGVLAVHAVRLMVARGVECRALWKLDSLSVGGAVTLGPCRIIRAMKRSDEKSSEEERKKLRETFNLKISHILKVAALLISVIAFASLIIGVENPKNVLLGLCLALILLCLATLQDHLGQK